MIPEHCSLLGNRHTTSIHDRKITVACYYFCHMWNFPGGFGQLCICYFAFARGFEWETSHGWFLVVWWNHHSLLSRLICEKVTFVCTGVILMPLLKLEKSTIHFVCRVIAANLLDDDKTTSNQFQKSSHFRHFSHLSLSKEFYRIIDNLRRFNVRVLW